VFIISICSTTPWIFKEIKCPTGPQCLNLIYVCEVHSGHNTGPDLISNCRFRYIFVFWCSSQVFIQPHHEYSRRSNVLQVQNVWIEYMHAEYPLVTIQVSTLSQIVDSDIYLYSGVHPKYLFNQGMSCRFEMSEWDISMQSNLQLLYRSTLHIQLWIQIFWCSSEVFIQPRHDYSIMFKQL